MRERERGRENVTDLIIVMEMRGMVNAGVRVTEAWNLKWTKETGQSVSKLIARLSCSSHIYRPSNNVDIGTGTGKIILDGYRVRQ